MKIASRVLSLLILAFITTFYTSCKKDDNDKQTQEEIQLNKLKAGWALATATDDSGDRTGDFGGLVLTIAGTYVEGGIYEYSLTGTRPDPSPWPASGNWQFGTNKATDIIRDPGTTDEIPMTYSVTDTQLIINFTIPDGSAGWPGGRIKSVKGNWSFTFNKQ